MQIQLNVPNDAANGSKWMIFRRSGAVSYATVFEGALYAGDDTDFELDTDFNDNGERDPVVHYSRIDDQKEAPNVGSDLKCGVSINHEALSAVLYNLERIAATARVMSEYKTIEHRRRAVDEINSYIESIKTYILE